MVDLSSFRKEAEVGTVYELKDPGGEPILKPDGKPVTITLAGTEGERWQKAQDIIANRRLKSSRAGSGFTPKTADEQRQDVAFLLAAVTLSWDGIVYEGAELECNPTNAKKLYIEVPFVREQVDTFLGEKRNFMKASSTD